jgi:hypothetical protein
VVVVVVLAVVVVLESEAYKLCYLFILQRSHSLRLHGVHVRKLVTEKP